MFFKLQITYVLNV